jgi:serine/threonine protein kinase
VGGAGTSGDAGGENVYALNPGTMLQEFRIERVLGSGGFGIAYLAQDTKNEVRVAIKEYLPGELAVRVSNSTVRARSQDDQKHFNDGVFAFLAEAKRVARVTHPNIMVVKRFFTLNGTGYIVLKYVEGQTLKEKLKSGRIPEKSVRSMMGGLLRGLVAIHDQKLLHRDIKPSNIILGKRKGELSETPVLIDFGAAREFRSQNSQSMTAFISPGYSPPEQYGVGGEQGAWTDLYALGATAYRCVAGDPPPDSLRRLKDDPLVPAVIKGAPDYSRPLLEIIDWMMVVSTADRPRSAGQVLELLEKNSGRTNPKHEDVCKIVEDGPDHFVVQIKRPPASSSLQLAFLATPPHAYLGPPKGKKKNFQDSPYYFKLDRVESDSGLIGFRGGAEIKSRLGRGAKVVISSADGVVNATSTWPFGHVGDAPDGRWKILPIVALVGAITTFGAAALNIGKIQDGICATGAFCTARQVAFKQVEACVAAAPHCSIESCIADFKSRGSTERFAARLAALEAGARSACQADEARILNQATQCARDNACGADQCFAQYRSQFANGGLRPQMDAALITAHQACARGPANQPNSGRNPPSSPPTQAQPAPQAEAPQRRPEASTPSRVAPTPPPAAQPAPPPPPAPTQPPQPALLLPDGTYSAVRSFTGRKSITDPANCPPSSNVQVTIRGGAITFEAFEMAAGVTRKWSGRVDQQTGTIGFKGLDAVPPTPNRYTIVGDYKSADIDSQFCGPGTFKIIK